MTTSKKGGGRRGQGDRDGSTPAVAPSSRALSFVRELQREFAGKPLSPLARESVRERLAKEDKNELRAIARRIMIDLLAPPVQPSSREVRSPPQRNTKAPGRVASPRSPSGRGKARKR